jgi:hypothetical protein
MLKKNAQPAVQEGRAKARPLTLRWAYKPTAGSE